MCLEEFLLVLEKYSYEGGRDTVASCVGFWDDDSRFNCHVHYSTIKYKICVKLLIFLKFQK